MELTVDTVGIQMKQAVNEAISRLENRRVKNIRPLIPPAILQEDLPLYAFI